MPDIASLTAEVQRLSHSVNSWNTGIIVMMVVAALAATGLVLTQMKAFGVAKQLADAQDRLIHAKDQQLAGDLKEKDLKISEATDRAAHADERTKGMELRVEELKNENLELQRKINPRFLTKSQQTTLLDGLRKFRGHSITVVRLGDAEAGQYADAIIAVFREAGWIIQQNDVGVWSPPTYGIIYNVNTAQSDASTLGVVSSFKTAKIEIVVQQSSRQLSQTALIIGLKPLL